MENNEIQKKIDLFLNEHKIKIQGGQINTEKDMSLLLSRIAKSEIDKGNYEKGLYFAVNSFKFDKKNLYSVFLQGLGFRFTGQYEDAIKAFKYCNSRKHDLASLANIGFCFAELKDSEKALDIFNKIIENITEEELKINYKLAVKYYKNSLRLNRVNHVLLNKLAACYYHFDDERKALYCYEEAVKVAPEEKNYEEAVKELRNAGVIPDVVEF